MAGINKLLAVLKRRLQEAVLAHWTRPTLALAIALGLGVAQASAAIPVRPGASPTEIAEAKRLLEMSGYTDIAVLSSDDRMVTAPAVKEGQKTVVDVDPMTGIILPHIDMAPTRSRLAPATDLAQTRAGGQR